MLTFKEEMNKSCTVNARQILGLDRTDPLEIAENYFKNPTVGLTSIDPNANVGQISPNSFMAEMAKPGLKLNFYKRLFEAGKKVYGERFSLRYIFNGDIYLHDATKLQPYCVGVSALDVLTEGRPYSTPIALPAKRLVSYMGQLTEYIMDCSQEWAGAVAVTDLIPCMAWFIEKGKGRQTIEDIQYSDKEIENVFQSFVHVLNNKFRVGGDSPFTNISVNSKDVYDDIFNHYTFPDGKLVEDMWKTIDRIQRIIVNFMEKGQSNGLPYRFPILTANFKSNGREQNTEWFKWIAEKNAKGFMNVNFAERFAMCCFPAGTLVRTRKGLIDISLVKEKDEVLTHQGRYMKVNQTNVRLYEGKGIYVELYYDEPFICTPEHPIMTMDGWKEAKNLSENDFVLKVPIVKETSETNIPLRGKNAWWFIGFYLAEGSCVSEQYGEKHRNWIVTLSCGKDEYKEVLEEISELEIYNEHQKKFIPINIHQVERPTEMELRISSQPLWNFLKQFGRGAENKHIPNEFKIYEDILDGYIFGDGWSNGKQHSIKSISKQLLFDAKQMLEYKGILARITTCYHSFFTDLKNSIHSIIEGREVNQSLCYNLQWSENQYQKKIIDDKLYVKIKSISSVNLNEEVYNLEVEEDESYIIEQAAVHNCRLNLEFDFKQNSFGGGGVKLGSMRVANVNLPRMAYYALKEKDDIEMGFYSNISNTIDHAIEYLVAYSKVFGDNVEAGYHKFFREPAKWFTTSMFFATVGFCGIYDAAEMIAQKTGSDIFQIEEKVIDIFLAKTREKSNGIKFNVEEVPSESAAGTMAKFNRDFKEIKVYYSNQFVPLNIDIPLNKRIEIEARLQSRLTGGGMTFLNFDAPLSPEQSFSLHKKLMDMRFHGQFCINYGFTQCLDCEKVQYGIQNKCGCGSENVLNISRVVGYYAVAQHAAKSKFTEIMERRVYSSI